MRKYLAPVFLALIAVAPGAAFAASATPAATSAAAQSSTGVVKVFNTEARSLELEDGTWFYLPLDFKAPDIKVGQKVTVHWTLNGTAHDVTNIEIS